MKRSILYLFCVVAVGGTACNRAPDAGSSSDPMASPSPTATATAPPVGEQLERQRDRPASPTDERRSPAEPNMPIHPGVGPGQSPSGSHHMVPPHRKPPVAAKMEV